MLVWFGFLFVLAWGIGALTVPHPPWFLHLPLVVGGGAMLVGVVWSDGRAAVRARAAGRSLTARLATASWPRVPRLRIKIERELRPPGGALEAELAREEDPNKIAR